MKNPSFKRKRQDASIDVRKLGRIKGFSLDPSMHVRELLAHYKSIGFQASHLGLASEIIHTMKKKKSTIFLACTSNMASSGLREIIAQLVKEKLIAAIITTTGFIEEDFMKSSAPFYLGSFFADDVTIKRNSLNRLGNILIPDKHYADFEDWHMDFISRIVARKATIAPSEYIQLMGSELRDTHSVLYQAAQHNVPIFCPGFVDGAIGDHFFFFNQKAKSKLIIDTVADVTAFYKLMLQAESASGIILGGGIAKHHLIGAAILRNGLDYAVYIQTGTEYDGSLSGAKPREAVSWNKLKDESNSVCVEADATLVFPLLAFALTEKKP